jgi:hypothetical protein
MEAKWSVPGGWDKRFWSLVPFGENFYRTKTAVRRKKINVRRKIGEFWPSFVG